MTRIFDAAAALGLLASMIAAVPAQAQTSASAYTSGVRFDKLGRQVGTIAPDPDGTGSLKYAATRTTYDAAGRQIKVEIGELSAWQATSVAPTAWTGFTLLGSIETSYDSLDRKIKVISKGNTGTIISVTQYSYDLVGRLECTAVRMNSATFSGTQPAACVVGPVASNGDEDRITKNYYDASGDLLKVQKAYGTSLQQDYATYTYTDNGKQASVRDANHNLASMTYDGHDRQTRWTFPSPTTVNTVNPADYEEYGYDANGNRTSLRKRDGSTLTYQYDALNRMTVKIVPERDGLSATHTRDVYYGYDLRGLQTYARFDSHAGDGITTIYDGFGRPINSTQHIDGTNRPISYLFDANGNRTELTWPDNTKTSYTYDGLGRMTFLSEGALGVGTSMVSYGYNPRGLLAWSATKSNAEISSTIYDNVGRPFWLVHDMAGTSHDVTYGFGNGYNLANQIATWTRDNDAYAWTGGANVNRAYAVNGLNQYASAGQRCFEYDANGNLTVDKNCATPNDASRTNYLYDVENRLVSASGAATAGLRYDPMGRLYETAGANTTRFLYDGDELVAEYNSADTLLRRYLHGSGSDDPVVWYEGSGMGIPRWLHTNHQGSVVALSDSGGTNIAINSYDEWGIPGASNTGRFQYTGQAWIPELGMYHYKARIYSPTLGRFLQTDPIGYDDQINLYAYVGNDPVNMADPSGKAGDNASKRGTPDSGCGSRIKGVNNCSGQSGADFNRANGDQSSGSKESKKGKSGSQNVRESVESGPVVTIGVALDLAVIGGGTVDGGVTIDLADGDVGTYGAVTAVAGVDISASVQVGVYENAQALVGEFQEIEIGILYGAGSGVLDTNGRLIGATGSLGLGLPASGRYSNGQGDIFGESEGKTQDSPIIVSGKRTIWQKVRNFFGF